MSRRVVSVEQGVFTVSFDDPPPSAERWRALAVGQARDELTGVPTLARVSGATDRRGVGVIGGLDGAFCFRARPWLVFPPLLAPGYSVAAYVEADGYLGSRIDLAVPSQQRQIIAPAPAAGTGSLHLNNVTQLSAGQLLVIGPPATVEHARIRHMGPAPQEVTLEGTFQHAHAIGDPVVADAWPPIDIGAVDLRRRPLVIRGRAIRRDAAANTVTPVAGAIFTLLDFWWSLADLRAQLPGAMTDPNPATRAFLLSVSPGIVAGRPLGSPVVDQPLTAAAGDDRLLLEAVPASSDRALVIDPPAEHRFLISSRLAIAAGDLLRVDADRLDTSETVTVSSVTGFGTPDQPGSIATTLPFRVFHRATAVIVRETPLAAGAPAVLRRDVQAGDRSVFVSDLSVFPSSGDVRLSGGTVPDELQRSRRFETTSDADGYFELPAVHRIAAIHLRATAAALTPVEFMLHPEYGQHEQWIEVLFA